MGLLSFTSSFMEGILLGSGVNLEDTVNSCGGMAANGNEKEWR